MEAEDAQPASSPLEPPNGRFPCKLDDKGRLKLPVSFQTFLGSFIEKGLFVTSTDRATAQIYPIAHWRASRKLLEAQRENKREAKIVLFNANDLGADAEMDGQGRITVNSELRQKLDMDGQGLHLYWKGGHIEVFTEARYQKMLQEYAAESESAVEKMEEAGLQ